MISAGYSCCLPWTTRVKIALEAAKGLAYLHDEENPVIFRDLKASNILLDSVISNCPGHGCSLFFVNTVYEDFILVLPSLFICRTLTPSYRISAWRRTDRKPTRRTSQLGSWGQKATLLLNIS